MSSVDLLEHLSVIGDPRIERNKKHDLSEMLFVAVCAAISGAEGWSDIVEFAEAKEEWLRRFVRLDNGIPVDDTFARVLSRIARSALQECLVKWTQSLCDGSAGEVIAIDGKTVRRSHDRRGGRGPLHLVRAWATEAGLALAQVATEVKWNEIVAIPVLLRYLELEGAIITIDAMGCQREIAAQVVEQGGDYVLAVKGNQASLHEAIVDFFGAARSHNFREVAHTYYTQTDSGHGRVEVRRCWASAHLDGLPHRDPWAGLQSIAMIEGERHVDGKVSVERRYFITSLVAAAEPIARAVSAHWQVENGCHWLLDMTFREDDSRIRRGHGAENFSTLRHFALNLLKQHEPKLSVRKKQIRAGFSAHFREELLWDVVFMAAHAVRAQTGGGAQLLYDLARVPRDGEARQAVTTTLKLIVGPGDGVSRSSQ